MSELTGLYVIWEREFRIFFREKSRIISSIFTPLLWLFVMGNGLGASVSIADFKYQTFIFPGIIVMSSLFTSIFYGSYVIWDRKLDFLKEVLVAPLSRTTIFLGKALGGLTDGIIQTTILLLLAPFFGIALGWNLILIYLTLIILVTGLVSLGLIFGSIIESPEGFGLIISFVNFPLFFLSGALFPLDHLPTWLMFFTRINPVTYGVDALRGIMLGANIFSLTTDLTALVVFAAVMIVIGSYAFKKMKL